MDRERLDDMLGKAILGVVCALLAFGPLALGGVREREFVILEGLGILGLVLWAARLVVGTQSRLLLPPVSWVVAAFAGYAYWRYQGAPVAYVAREEWVRVALYTTVFFLILNHLNRQDSPTQVTAVILAIGTGISIYAVYQFITGSDRVWSFVKPAVYLKRGSGTYICPNHLAGYLELVLPLGLAYTLIGRVSHVGRVLSAYATVACLCGIGVSVSRGAWLSVTLSLVFFLVLLARNRSHRLPALVFAVLLVGGGVYGATQSDAVVQRFEKMLKPGQVEYILERVHLWKPTIAIWRDHFWLGAGPAHFDVLFRQYRPVDYQVRPLRAHNDYLNLLADWGTVGAILVGLGGVLLVWGLVRCWKFVQKSNDLGSRTSNRMAFVLGATTGLFALALHSFVDFNLHIPANAVVATALAALLAVHLRHATERFWVPARLPVRLVLAAVLLAAGLGFAQDGRLRWREQALLGEAENQALRAELRRSEFQKLTSRDEVDPVEFTRLSRDFGAATRGELAALKAAAAADPSNGDTLHRVGESLRALGWAMTGAEGKPYLEEAITWYDRSAAVNPFDPYNPLRKGMCLDRLRRTDEAAPFFEQAVKLDPNGYYTAAHMGWHYFQLEQDAEARKWFERSLKLKAHTMPDANPIAYAYLQILNRRAGQAGR